MSYIGNPIVSTDFPVDYASGNGSTTAFTLSIAPASVNAVDVEVSGVSQSPQTYTLSGTTLTFSAAPPSGTNNIVFKHRGVAGIPNTPSAGSVVTSSIAANAVTPAKMANGGAEFGMRNRIINGDMRIDQRNAGASVTPTTTGANVYTLDRWAVQISQASKFSVQQNAGSITPPVGFSKYLGITSLAATSLAAGDYFVLSQNIEGFNTSDLGFGTANAKTVTLSFQVYSSLTGIFSGSLSNNSGNRTYPFSYSIPVANTWTAISVTIAGDTSGTWTGATNGTGMIVFLGLGVGSTYSGTAGAWAGSQYLSATGATSVVGTSGATFYITGVQLEVGSSATNFDYRSYGQELALCQRYYYLHASGTTNKPISTGLYYDGSGISTTVQFPTSMRTQPTISQVTGTNYYSIYRSGVADLFNSFTLDFASTNAAQIYNATEVSGTGGQAGSVYCNNAASFLAFSAEL